MNITKRPEAGAWIAVVPDVIAGERDVLPSEGCDVHEEVVGNNDASGTQVLDGTVEVDGIPVDDCSGDEAQAGCTEALVLEGPIADFALTVEEDRSAQGVACLALVEPGMAALTQVGIRQPLQGEQGALDPAERPQGARQSVAEGMTVPAWIEALRRMSTAHWLTTAAVSTMSPISGSSSG